MAILPLAGWAEAVKATLRTVPETLSGLYYNGGEQPITKTLKAENYLSDYQINHGGVKFVVKTTEEDPTVEEKTAATVVTTGTFDAKDAGYHYIYYQVLGDGTANYDDGDWTYLGCVYINKAIRQGIAEAPTFKSELKYTGSAQILIETAGDPKGDDEQPMEYQIEGGSWVTSIDDVKGTNAGDYVVNWRVQATTNWEAAEGQTTVNIEKADVEITNQPDLYGGLTYNRAAQQLIKTDGESTFESEISYSIDGNNWSTDIDDDVLKGTNAGEYTVYYKVEATANYNGIASAELGKVTIEKKSLTADGITAGLFTSTYTFTGSEIADLQTSFNVKDNGEQLIWGWQNNERDIKTVEYRNNINAAAADADVHPYVVVEGTGNYKDQIEIPFTIAPAAIEDVTIENIDPQEYDGQDIAPSVMVKLGDYEIDNNEGGIKVEFENNRNAGIATVKVTPEISGSNFTGVEKTTTFTINKATLTVIADAKSKFFGDTDDTVETSYSLDGFKEGDNKDNIGLTGAPIITRDDSEEVGLHTYSVDVNDLASTNYNFVAASLENQGGLTIIASTVIITPNAVANQTYGYRLPADLGVKDAFEFTASGLRNGANITELKYSVKNSAGVEQVAGALLPVGTYTITTYDAVCDAAGYTLTYGETTFKVNKYQIKLVAQNQEVTFGEGEPVLNSTGDTYVKAFDDEDNDITADFSTMFDSELAQFFDDPALIWEAEAGYESKPVAHPGYIVVNLKNYDSDNFEVETVKGNVTYTGLPTALELTRTEDVYNKIKEHDGQTLEVTFTDRSLVAEKWNAFVLPFEISAAKLSAAVGYAVFNVLDETNSTADNIKFKLYMGTIPANQPFLMKTAEDKNMEDVAISDVTIVAPATATPSQTIDGIVEFTGLYQTKTGLAANERTVLSDKWYTNIPSATLTALTAYLKTLGANAPVITLEEPDGTVTSINTVETANGKSSIESLYNLNGVRVQGTAEKGVYIQNGKKVIVK